MKIIMKKDYSKYEARDEYGTLSFNHVLLHKKNTKCIKLFFYLYLDGNNNIYFNSPYGELFRDTLKDIVNIEEYKWAFYKPE